MRKRVGAVIGMMAVWFAVAGTEADGLAAAGHHGVEKRPGGRAGKTGIYPGGHRAAVTGVKGIMVAAADEVPPPGDPDDAPPGDPDDAPPPGDPDDAPPPGDPDDAPPGDPDDAPPPGDPDDAPPGDPDDAPPAP